MDEHFFDDLAKGLDDGTITRRRALKLVGGAALGAALMPLLPKQAQALTRKFRRRCHRKGGVPVERGNCHCARQCMPSTGANFSCQNNASCICSETVEGRGFCSAGGAGTNGACTSSAQCTQPGWACVVQRGCPGSGGSCTSNAQCNSTGGYSCFKGTCQLTFCFPPC
jgi:hypothetical protein